MGHDEAEEAGRGGRHNFDLLEEYAEEDRLGLGNPLEIGLALDTPETIIESITTQSVRTKSGLGTPPLS